MILLIIFKFPSTLSFTMWYLGIHLQKKKDRFKFTDEEITINRSYFSPPRPPSGAFINEKECLLRSHMNITLHKKNSQETWYGVY
jgi:hypothetical protein